MASRIEVGLAKATGTADGYLYQRAANIRVRPINSPSASLFDVFDLGLGRCLSQGLKIGELPQRLLDGCDKLRVIGRFSDDGNSRAIILTQGAQSSFDP